MHVIQPRVFTLTPCPSNEHVKGKGSGKEREGLRNTTYHPEAGQVTRLPAQIPVPNATRKVDSRLAVIHEKCPGRPSKIQDANADVFGLRSRDFSKAPMIETRHRTNDWSSSEKPAMAGGVQRSFYCRYITKNGGTKCKRSALTRIYCIVKRRF